MPNVIEVSHLTKKYKDFTAVDDISFDVAEGEILGLLGPNGSGKTTTINCLLSLLTYQAGDIKIFGQEMKPDSYELKGRIGVVFQDIAVFDELSVRDNIDYFCGLYIEDKAARSEDVEKAMEFVGLEKFSKFRPKQLSGGLLRRLNIACGIAHNPKLLFADEPTAAIDPQSRNNILDGIRRLRENGTTVVYTTHYMEEVELICDRVIILDRGKIIARGTIDELKDLSTTKEKIAVENAAFSDEDLHAIRQMDHVIDVAQKDQKWIVSYGEGHNNLVSMVDFLRGRGIRYEGIYSGRPTLNDVFLELTGKELRD